MKKKCEMGVVNHWV